MRGISKRRVIDIATGIGLTLGLGWAVIHFESERRLAARFDVPLEGQLQSRDLEGDPTRGRHLAGAVAQCTFCHGEDLGGRAMADDPWVGRLHASNLTTGRGGVARRYDDATLARAIRHGVGADGRSLLLMPSSSFARLSDGDLADILAWLREAPPVDSEQPPRRVGPLTRLVLSLGLAPELVTAAEVDHGAVGAATPSPSADAEYGAYLVQVGTCRVCHRADLAGGLHPLALPGEPPPANLTPAGPIGTWTERQFLTVMRAGTTPEGRVLDPEFMPWLSYAQMSDTELRAIWSYLGTLPPIDRD